MLTSVVDLRSPISALVREATHVSSNATLTSAARAMREANVSAVLVGPGRDAILTERDMALALAAEFPAEGPVSDIATPNPLIVLSTIDTLDAVTLMLNHQVRHLVVESPGGTIGIVSLRELMAVLLQAAKPEIWLSNMRVEVDMPLSEQWLG